MNKGVETIKHNNHIIAIIIYNDYKKDGVEFFTPADFSQQLAYMSHKKGKIIDAHSHNVAKRDISLTQEALFVKKGKLKVNLYDSERNFLESRIIGEGEIIFLASGGHGFEVLEDLEMIEVKQGPHLGAEEDKVRFKGIEK
jgi:hypothetical protein